MHICRMSILSFNCLHTVYTYVKLYLLKCSKVESKAMTKVHMQSDIDLHCQKKKKKGSNGIFYSPSQAIYVAHGCHKG